MLLANYRSGTLRYRELIVFSHATPRGMVVTHIYVDDEQSLRGGREIWGLPKELASSTTTGARSRPARTATRCCSARIRRRPGCLPLLVPAPIVSEAGDTIGRARIKAAPALVTLDVPATARSRPRAWTARIWRSRATTCGLTMPPPKRELERRARPWIAGFWISTGAARMSSSFTSRKFVGLSST